MNKKQGTVVASAGFLTAAAIVGCNTQAQDATPAVKADERPNIIVMMVDDMGFSDPGCFGGEIHTPNIDRLAERGVRFTKFHNCARCCPTRASLLTGLYPHQVGLTRNGSSMTRDGATIPELLREDGYYTAMVGKWHLSQARELPNRQDHQKWLDHQLDHDIFAPKDSYPASRGFDHHYGVIWGVIDHFDPFSLVEGYEPVKNVPEDYYFADAITDKAINYIEESHEENEPFFLYYAHCAPHWPIMAKPEDIAKYKDTYKDGWEKLRNDRYKRQQAMGIFGDTKVDNLPVMDHGRKWDSLSEQEKEYEARKMAVHAAMVDNIDQNLGRLLDTLDKTGEYDNTIIVFLADNGASPEIVEWGPGYDRSGETRDGRKQLYGYDNPPVDILGSETSYVSIGAPWANAANTPFRFWKKESYEGGANTPCIISWPKGLKAKAGSITTDYAHVMDIMPTCLELAKVDYPTEFNGHKIGELGGKSLMPIIKGKHRTDTPEYFFEHEMGRAVLKDGWKLVAHSGRPRQWELYNMDNDITESHNLAKQYPAKVEELNNDWNAWAEKVGTKEFFERHLPKK